MAVAPFFRRFDHKVGFRRTGCANRISTVYSYQFATPAEGWAKSLGSITMATLAAMSSLVMTP